MGRRPPQVWRSVGRVGVVCLVASAVALTVAVWMMERDQAGGPSATFKFVMGLFAGFAFLGLLAVVAANQCARFALAVQALDVDKRGVEVAVYRDPHDVSEVAVFIDGKQVAVDRMHEVDPEIEPGAYTPEEWQEMAADAVAEPGASCAWSRQVRAWYDQSEAVLHEE